MRCGKHHDHGIVLLDEVAPKGAVKFRVLIKDVSPGKHGFHIHQKGNELKGADSLCKHFNPNCQKHGDINTKSSHVGDLGNLTAIPFRVRTSKGIFIRGRVNTEFIAERVRLSGKNSIFGRSLILHEDEDDLGKGSHSDSLTTGHSGARILWGIIGVND